MKFLRSFPRRHLAGKPVVASPSVGCLLKLISICVPCFFFYGSNWDEKSSHAFNVFSKISNSNLPLSHLNQWLCFLTEAYDLSYKVLIPNNSELGSHVFETQATTAKGMALILAFFDVNGSIGHVMTKMLYWAPGPSRNENFQLPFAVGVLSWLIICTSVIQRLGWVQINISLRHM